MTTYKTLCMSTAGNELIVARRLTDDEKAQYLPEYQNWMFLGTGAPHIPLKNLYSVEILPVIDGQRADGAFPGCGNLAYIISDSQWNELIAMDQDKVKAEMAAQEAAEIESLRIRKAAAERQMVNGMLPSTEEAKRLAAQYNELHNEGGEGYIPHYYSSEEYARICERLEALE